MNCFSRVLCHSIAIFISQFKNVNASMIICISFYCLDWSIATLPWSLRAQCQADGCRAWRLVHKLATKRLTCLIILDDCSSGMTSLSISSTVTTVITIEEHLSIWRRQTNGWHLSPEYDVWSGVTCTGPAVLRRTSCAAVVRLYVDDDSNWT